MTASAAPGRDWLEANQQYLSAALAVVRSELKSHVQRSENTQKADDQINAARQAMQEAKSVTSSPFPLDMLCITFGLSLFERDVLLLC
ncbi:MAG: ATP-binding protein, partial [Candidatus Omnitrophica bacterium]|nr:ATP-binding protein [Candidatus Omnitrophota bacterium]